MGELKFNTPYLNDYLQMVEDTESPRIFHIWSAVLSLSAALGRRCYLPFGTFDIHANHMILLVGAPGTRKTTASNMSRKLLKASTGVRFAPKDTGFQRQGLIKAMQGKVDEDSKEFLSGEQLGANNSILSLTELSQVTNEPEDEKAEFISVADKHALTIVASEFSRVIGQNNMSMMDFLGSCYDGEDYDYQTNQNHIVLKNTLINMIACTTPVSIANSLPPQAGGQGFLSRIILVYGSKKYKKVPRPAAPPLEIVDRIHATLDNIYYQMSGAFDETEEARLYCESLYDYRLDITDSRFAYYSDRRFTHLIKLAMCLAASRGTQTIEIGDYEESHRILRATERGMPDALGEFGMNPLAMLKQEILEQLRMQQGPLTMPQVVAMFHRDAKTVEIIEVLNDLVRVGQVQSTQLKGGERVLSARYVKENTEDEMLNLLSER